MSPPIRDGSGDSIGAIRLGDGSEISEVRTGAGDVLFSSGLANSVVSRWNFEDSSDTTTATDSVGSNDGTINSASYTSNSQVGSFALSFDGSNDFVDVPDFAGGRNAISFGGFVKITTNSGLPRIVGSGSNSFRLMDQRNNNRGFLFSINGSPNVNQGTNTYTTGDVVFLVAVYDSSGLGDGSTMKIYRDDATEIASGSPTTQTINTGNLQLGVRPNNAGDHLEGTLDDIRVYSKALSSTEVSNWFNTGTI